LLTLQNVKTNINTAFPRMCFGDYVENLYLKNKIWLFIVKITELAVIQNTNKSKVIKNNNDNENNNIDGITHNSPPSLPRENCC
jgi:hypothetical protein